MDKNLLWAVTLSIGIYALWFGVIEKRYVKPVQPASTATSVVGAGAPTPRAPSGDASALAGENSRPALPGKTTAPEAAAGPVAAVDRTALEADAEGMPAPDSELKVHPDGAAIVSCRFRGPLGTVELIPEPRPGFFATWPKLRFRPEPSGEGRRYATVRPDGMRIIKEFLPETPGKLPRIRVSLRNPTGQPLAGGAWTLNIGPGLDTVPSEAKENHSVWRAAGLLFGDKGLQGKVEVFKQPGEHAGPYRWVGVDNRYFLAAAVPAEGDFDAVESFLPPQVVLRAKNVVIAPGEQRDWEIPYYFGAKGQLGLSRYPFGLERAIDFGYFSWLARKMMQLLGLLHARIGNWGWAIVLMTFFIQALLFPLTYKSMKAMAAMKKLQPDIARLQQKYAKEPSRLNAEMMELYKKSGANPLGGCLPLMLQMPVFIALFNALRNSWELHGTPWMFWVHDLSAKDPYRVLPIVMGGVMWVQNRLNPATASDPTQKAMMNWMPVIFTVMFLNTPSGLVLYWLTSSMISASMQMGLRRHFEQA
ncbi:MAG: YidC/Oxa1 family insertase periplasmic-domain containing protein [Elusimicrobia bacterium]|nr:YidC/Oxa1 family insertase periplasmic-domain containing protein [Elusimicrobiota bacterium]